MNKNVLKICIFILTAFIGMSAFGCSVYAAENKSCSGNCSAANKCKPARNGFSYVSTSSSNVINGKCIKDATANGCYNANPTSCSGSYNGLGSRGSSRNHYGSDIGSAACGAAKGKIQVYAPADGTIVWTGVSNVYFLQDSGVEIDRVKFFGLAYNHPEELIPDDAGIIVTHEPPVMILDESAGTHWGNAPLRNRILDIKPRYHLFGHTHESYGTLKQDGIVYSNASLLNERNQLVRKPRLFLLK